MGWPCSAMFYHSVHGPPPHQLWMHWVGNLDKDLTCVPVLSNVPLSAPHWLCVVVSPGYRRRVTVNLTSKRYKVLPTSRVLERLHCHWQDWRTYASARANLGTRIWGFAKTSLVSGAAVIPMIIGLLQNYFYVMPANTQVHPTTFCPGPPVSPQVLGGFPI